MNNRDNIPEETPGGLLKPKNKNKLITAIHPRPNLDNKGRH